MKKFWKKDGITLEDSIQVLTDEIHDDLKANLDVAKKIELLSALMEAKHEQEKGKSINKELLLKIVSVAIPLGLGIAQLILYSKGLRLGAYIELDGVVKSSTYKSIMSGIMKTLR